MASRAPRPERPDAAPRQFRIDRRWGRVLLVGAVVTAVALPTTDALAAGRSGAVRKAPRPAAARHPAPAKPARPAKPAKPARPAKPVRPAPATTSDPAAAVTTAPDPVSGGGDTGVEPLRRTGEDLRWWPWGGVVSGRLVRPVKGGYQTLVLQRGEITAIGTGTVTVTSTDGVVTTWTVTARTRITGLPRTRPPARGAGGTPGTSSPSPTADPAARLALHQRVGIWGTESGGTVTAGFVMVRGTAPTASPTPSPTDPSPTDPSPTDPQPPVE